MDEGSERTGRTGVMGAGVVWVHSVRPRIFNADEVAFVQRMAIELARSSAPARPQDALEMLLDDAHQIVARFDHDLRVTYLNREGQRLLGDLIGRTCREAGLPECVADVCERTLRAMREQVAEFAVRTRFGESHFETRILPELAPDGSVRSLLSISRDVTEKRKAQSEHVTARQRDVLRLLIRGWSNREIAAELGLAPGTVKNHVADILEQLDVKDRTQAAVRAIELGITLPD